MSVSTHDADAGEVLLLVLADDGHAGARPAPRVEIAHRIARAVRTHAEEVHRLAALRRERDAAGLVTRGDHRREPRDVGDAGDDVHLDRLARAARAAREPERSDGGRGERIEVMEPAGDEARAHRDARDAGLGLDDLAGRRIDPRAVPRQERSAHAERRHRQIAAPAAREGERDLLADGHAARGGGGDGHVVDREAARGDHRPDEHAREDGEEDVGARTPDVDGERADDEREERERPALLGERPPDVADARCGAAEAARAETIALLLRRRDEDVVEAREVDLHRAIRSARARGRRARARSPRR